MKILGLSYTVDRSRTMVDIGVLGRMNETKLMIQVASDLTAQQATSTMLHEIIEAINSALKMDFTEHTVRLLEVSLYQVLSENGVNLEPLMRESEEE